MMKKLALLAAIVAACGGHAPATNAPSHKQAKAAQKPLYDRLGGQGAIVAVVDDFVDRVAADARNERRFANSQITPL
jgi:hemoglobin